MKRNDLNTVTEFKVEVIDFNSKNKLFNSLLNDGRQEDWDLEFYPPASVQHIQTQRNKAEHNIFDYVLRRMTYSEICFKFLVQQSVTIFLKSSM